MDTAFEDRVRALKSQTLEKQVTRLQGACMSIVPCSMFKSSGSPAAWELCPSASGQYAVLFLLLGSMAASLPKRGACCDSVLAKSVP